MTKSELVSALTERQPHLLKHDVELAPHRQGRLLHRVLERAAVVVQLAQVGRDAAGDRLQAMAARAVPSANAPRAPR